jgi:hypothetical protein
VINKELDSIEDKFNLNNISLNGKDEVATNLYTFQGEDFGGKKVKVGEGEGGFIEIGQRERKQQNYDVDNYYRRAFNTPMPGVKDAKDKKKLKGWRSYANGGYDH